MSEKEKEEIAKKICLNPFNQVYYIQSVSEAEVQEYLVSVLIPLIRSIIFNRASGASGGNIDLGSSVLIPLIRSIIFNHYHAETVRLGVGPIVLIPLIRSIIFNHWREWR